MEKLAPCLLLMIAACSQPTEVASPQSPAAFPASQPGDPARVAEMWARSCALCHVDGTAGAPVVGDAQAWAPRLAKGRDTLLAHTLEGLDGMPPLGYCMACETDDFLAMIDLMTEGLAAREAQP